MPRPLRLTMFFTDGETGWSESQYDTTSQSLQSAVTFAIANLLPQRRQLLADGPWLKYLRASYDDTFRDSQVFFTPQPPPTRGGTAYNNNPNWTGDPAAVEFVTVLLRGVGGDLYRKQIYVSGVPYTDTPDTATPQGDPTLVKAFQGYASTLVANGYGFPVWLRDVTTFPMKTISGIIPATAGYNFNIPAHQFSGAFGTRVYLSNLRFYYPQGDSFGQRTPNGAYAYIVVDNNTINIPAFRFPVGAVFVSGLAQLNQRGVVPYQSLLMERFTHRKRGRPFDSPRGRSRRRRATGPQVA